MDMPKVQQCQVEQCAYNHNKTCHAMAITIGNGSHPHCDTYFTSGTKGGESRSAGVGACKTSTCKFNKSFECHASKIQVGAQTDEADCLTFTAR